MRVKTLLRNVLGLGRSAATAAAGIRFWTRATGPDWRFGYGRTKAGRALRSRCALRYRPHPGPRSYSLPASNVDGEPINDACMKTL